MAATAVPPTAGGGGGVAETPLPLDDAVALFVRAAVVTRAQNRSVDEHAFIATERKAPLPAVNLYTLFRDWHYKGDTKAITERSVYSKVTALTALVRPSDAKQHAFINPSAQNEDAVRARCLCSHSNYSRRCVASRPSEETRRKRGWGCSRAAHGAGA